MKKHELAVMGSSGDTKVLWEPQTDTDEARAAVAEAERVFAEHVGQRGASAFVVDPNDPSNTRRVDAFDPTAERTVIVPRMQGG